VRIPRQLSLAECDKLFASIRSTQNPDELAAFFDALLKEQPLLGYALGRGSFFWRGRKCVGPGGWPTAFDMVYPPPKLAALQRLNNSGDPLLYASTRKLTVLTELDVQEGDFVHLIAIRMKQGAGVHFMALGDFYHVFKAGFSRLVGDEAGGAVSRTVNDFGAEMGLRVIYVDAFLSSLLSDPLAHTNDYAQTRALRYAVFQKIKEGEGFFYPSVRDTIGMNLAIRPETFDTKGQIMSSQVIQILRKREFGFYDFRYCRHAKWFEGDGSFVWLPETEHHEWVLFGMTTEEEQFMRSREGMLRGNEFFDFMRVSTQSD